MIRKACVNLINLYQKYIRAMLPSSCRFVPTCSEYAKQAIVEYGFFKGIFMGIKRLLKCHPFSGTAGNDPLSR